MQPVAAQPMALPPSVPAVQDESATEAESRSTDDQLEQALALQRTVVAAVARAERSVVAIARVRKGSVADPSDPRFVPHQFASGVVLDREGHILTNYHVLGDPTENDYFVWLQQRPFPAVRVLAARQVQAADPWTDLAILKLDVDAEIRASLRPIKLGDGNQVQKGQFVIALGNPYALARDGEPSASWGIISNLSRQRPRRVLTDSPNNADDSESTPQTLHDFGTLIQTDATLPLGTSGGALLDLRGEMVGLTVSLAAMDRYESSTGFAIPVDATFRRTLEQLRQGEAIEYGFLGVSPRDLSARERQGGGQGITVAQVFDGTPAAQAGIQFGDRITHLDDVPIENSLTFLRELGRLPVNAEITVSVQRRQVGVAQPRHLQLPVRLSKKYLPGELRPYTSEPARRWRGLRVDYATAIPRFGERSRFVDPEGCIAIVEVEPGSVSWKAGLRPRDFISHVDEQRVRSPEEFWRIVARAATATTEIRLTHAARGGSKKFQVPPNE